jgi:DNA-binding beta-propeller fold protein YncE
MRALLPFLLLWGLTADAPERPGHETGRTVLLPNGWRIAPAGRHVPLGDLPLDLVESPDGGALIVTNNGYGKPSLSVVNTRTLQVQSRIGLEHAWLGLALHPDGKRLFASGGGAGTVQEFTVQKGSLTAARAFSLHKPTKDSFVGGISVSSDGASLYAVQVLGNVLSRVALGTGDEGKSVPLPAEPYTTLPSPDGKALYVSLWGGAKVLVLDPNSLETRNAIPVGEHPNAMALSPDGRLFVACANTNSVYVVGLDAGKAEEQISTALSPGAPPGSTPNGLGLSPDGRTLLVPNADNNAVAVVDVSRRGASRVMGFIPTGWYPTAARFSRDGRRIFVLSGKGLSSAANPRGPSHPSYIGDLLSGSLSVVDTPDEAALAGYTKTVHAVTPYSDATRLAPPKAPKDSPIPARVGGSSPIKHVFYLIRENRTFDQVLGDLGKGNGDPNLCLFGKDVTPNAHALAAEFVLLDNFYVDADVSADGHAFSTAAYATDFVKKTWPMYYGRKEGAYLSEGGGPNRNPYGNVAAPLGGYLWDAARKEKVSVRSYGEFVHRGDDPEEDSGVGPAVPSVPGLEGMINPAYPPWNLEITDNARVDVWLEEFRRYEAEGGLPALSIIRLPNDHTMGTKPGVKTPRAMVAENDLALGRIVEAVSKSRFWAESVLLVLEDDAQDGPDHVDAHRSVALLAGPHVRRGAIDSTLYTTSGVLRTIELILGLPPMSQYDAAATPLYGAFQAVRDPRPFEHRPNQISLDEVNDVSAFGAAASQALDFTEADRTPMQALNEILWGSVKGPGAVMPPPVRSAVVTTRAGTDDD